jgi:hypothetical protein
MPEIKQKYYNYWLIFLSVVVLGIIVFFTKKWLEFKEREKERESKIQRLEKNIRENGIHNKAVFSKLTKKLNSMDVVHPQKPSSVTKAMPEEEEDENMADTLTELMS